MRGPPARQPPRCRCSTPSRLSCETITAGTCCRPAHPRSSAACCGRRPPAGRGAARRAPRRERRRSAAPGSRRPRADRPGRVITLPCAVFWSSSPAPDDQYRLVPRCGVPAPRCRSAVRSPPETGVTKLAIRTIRKRPPVPSSPGAAPGGRAGGLARGCAAPRRSGRSAGRPARARCAGHLRAARPPHREAQPRAAGEPRHRCGDRPRVAGCHQLAGEAVIDQVQRAAHGRRHHREPAGGGLL